MGITESREILLIFRVGTMHIGAAVDSVVSVITPPPMISLPTLEGEKLKVFAYRDEPALAILLRDALGMKPDNGKGDGCIILTRLENRLVGFWVDEAEDMAQPESYRITEADPQIWLANGPFDYVCERKDTMILHTRFADLARYCDAFSGDALRAAQCTAPDNIDRMRLGQSRAQLDARPENTGAGDDAGQDTVAEDVVADSDTDTCTDEDALSGDPTAEPVAPVEAPQIQYKVPPRPAIRAPQELPVKISRPVARPQTKEPPTAERSREVYGEYDNDFANRPLNQEKTDSKGTPILIAVVLCIGLLAGAWLFDIPYPWFKQTRPVPVATLVALVPEPPAEPGPVTTSNVDRIEADQFTIVVERTRPRETDVRLPEPTRPTAPEGENTIVHRVVKGDTLWHIARRYIGDPYQYPQLARLSQIKDPDWIYPGDTVRIIRKSPAH